MKVQTLRADAVPEVVDVLAESFFDYPVMRYVLGTEDENYPARLKIMVNLFVMARVLSDETLLGIGDSGNLDAAAVVSRSNTTFIPPELTQLRTEVWTTLGTDAKARYDAFSNACSQAEIEDPHLHLNMIGVRRSSQGSGLGRELIEHVQQLSRDDTKSNGVSLTTEDERNVSFYKQMGFEIVGHEAVSPELTTWSFFRAD